MIRIFDIHPRQVRYKYKKNSSNVGGKNRKPAEVMTCLKWTMAVESRAAISQSKDLEIIKHRFADANLYVNAYCI